MHVKAAAIKQKMDLRRTFGDTEVRQSQRKKRQKFSLFECQRIWEQQDFILGLHCTIPYSTPN